MTKHIQILLVPWSWPLLWCGDAGYFGRRWFLGVGPFLILIWQLTEAQHSAWCKEWFGETAE